MVLIACGAGITGFRLAEQDALHRRLQLVTAMRRVELSVIETGSGRSCTLVLQRETIPMHHHIAAAVRARLRCGDVLLYGSFSDRRA